MVLTRDHQVRRLDVPMNHESLMSDFQPIASLDQPLNQLSPLQRPFLFHCLPEGLAV